MAGLAKPTSWTGERLDGTWAKAFLSDKLPAAILQRDLASGDLWLWHREPRKPSPWGRLPDLPLTDASERQFASPLAPPMGVNSPNTLSLMWEGAVLDARFHDDEESTGAAVTVVVAALQHQPRMASLAAQTGMLSSDPSIAIAIWSQHLYTELPSKDPSHDLMRDCKWLTKVLHLPATSGRTFKRVSSAPIFGDCHKRNF